MKCFYLLALALLACFGGKAQTPLSNQPEQECINGIPVCQSGYVQNNAYAGNGATQELNATNRGCLGSNEKNDVWYIITVSTTGVFNLSITPNDTTDDYDFAVWDITNGGCQAIYNGAPPIGAPPNGQTSACNFSGAPGRTGLNTVQVAAGLSQWSNSLNVTAGQVLALNVSNYEDVSQNGYVLDFTGSTAGFIDNVAPYFASAFNRCSFIADSIDVTLSEQVLCSSLAGDGSNFKLTPLPAGIQVVSAQGLNCVGGNAYTRTVRVRFSAPLPAGNYTISPLSGTNGTFLRDACGNDQTTTGTGRSVSFSMVPPVPPAIISYDTPACSHITVHFDRGVKCNTVAPDGSDFFINGPSPVTITHADASQCDSFGLVTSIDLHFDSSIVAPGAYIINFKTGTDGNRITDTCGQIVNRPFRFDVSDASVTVTATPPVLCKPDYIKLTTAINFALYGSLVRCGTNGGPDLVGTTPVNDTVGTFADTTDGVINPTPFDGSQRNVRTQFLYTASELTAAGLRAGRIKRLSFFVGDKQSTTAFQNLNIKMGCTQRTFLDSFTSRLPFVYSANTFSTRRGENQFVLNDAYDWDGASNLIVEMCYSDSTFTAGLYDQIAYTNTTFNSVYLRADTNKRVQGCAFNNNSGQGGAFTARPTLSFGMLLPPTPSYQYLWLPSNYVEDSTAATTLAFVPVSPRVFSIRALDQSGCYRRGSTTVQISMRNPYKDPRNDTSLCIGGSANLAIGNGVRYEWLPDTTLSCDTCSNPIATPTQTTTYYGVVFDQYGCTDTLTARVVVNPLPIVNAGPDTSILYSFGVPLFARTTGARFYAWTPTAGLNYANIPNPIATPLLTTEYILQVIDSNYCVGYDSVNVRVRTDVPSMVPNAFTPNGDFVNDNFQVVNLGINKLVEMRIFNRWGNQIFYTTDNTRGWDGTFNGEPQDIGVYKYIIRIVKPDGGSEEMKGDITLVR